MTTEEIERELTDLSARTAKLRPVWEAVAAEMDSLRKRAVYLRQLLAEGKEPPTVSELTAATAVAIDAFANAPAEPET